jgi:hypothetical protein
VYNVVERVIWRGWRPNLSRRVYAAHISSLFSVEESHGVSAGAFFLVTAFKVL